MEKTGERLKNIRLEKGISLEEVHKRTRVHLSILRAIEDDDFINLNPVYVKGFIKLYCQFLGVNPADFIKEHREPLVTVTASDTEDKAVTFLRPPPPRSFAVDFKLISFFVGVIAAVFLLIALLRFIGGQMSRMRADARKPVAAAQQQKKKRAVKPAAKPALKQAPQPRQQAVAPAAKPATNAVKPATGAGSSAAEKGTPIRVGIHAKEDCWLQVKVDGKTVFQSVLARGRLESWQAQEKIELSLGSAGGVELEINGSRIPPLGRKGQVLRNVRINRDGLQVGK
jgi:cytoskeleton protein RodZ